MSSSSIRQSYSNYYLRSRSDKELSIDTTSTICTVSPTSPLDSTSPTPIQQEQCMRITRSKFRKQQKRNSRKRQFSQIENDPNDSESENQDIDLNVNLHSNTNTTTSNNKKRKLTQNAEKCSRMIKFTLNDEAVISREASLKPSSPLITNNKRRRYPRIEEFEIKLNVSHRSLRRNPYICCYSFFNGYKIGITMTLGHRSDVKDAIKILSQELVSTRAKASIQTQKNSFLVYIKTRKDKMIGCSIVHVDHTLKRVNIEMFAVDESWRGNGFASMMVYLIQYKMINYYGYDLFVCAATSAVPFWSNKKYNFVQAAKSLLEQHEIEDEKHGGTKHLIWYGTPIQARCALLKTFVQSC